MLNKGFQAICARSLIFLPSSLHLLSIMERQMQRSLQHVCCGYCGDVCREKNFSNHLYRKHNGAPRKFAESEEHAQLLRLQWEEVERKKKVEQQRAAIEKERQRLLEKKREREKQAEIERQQILQRKEKERKRREEEEKKKIERKRKKKAQAVPSGKFADPKAVSHDHDYGSRQPQAHDGAQEIPTSTHRAGDNSVMAGVMQSSSYSAPAAQEVPQKDKNGTAEPEPSWSPDVSATEVRKRFHESKTVEDVSRSSACFDYDETNSSFLYKPCQSVWGGKVGLIAYPPPDPEAPDSIHKSKFRDLKKKMLNHLENSARHQTAVKELGGHSNTTEDDELNYEAGLVIGRTAYGGVKKGESYLDFEKDVAMKNADLKRLGKQPGDINHSASFASSLTPAFHDELKERIKEKLHQPLPGTGEPPPFAIVCDKMTPSKKPLHAIGIISPVDNGKLFATYLEAEPSFDGTGAGSAQEVKDAVSKMYPPELLRNRFVGAAVDGAYVRNNFKEHLLEQFDIKEEDQDAYTENWDPAHIIECAGKDSRKQKGKNQIIGVEWIKKVADTVNSVETKYSIGKSLQNMEDNAKLTSNIPNMTDVDMPADSVVQSGDRRLERVEHDPIDAQPERGADKVKKLKTFSTTRFTTHAHEALSAFRKDWGHIYDCMKESDDKKLPSIKDPEFVLGLCGMEDVYDVIGEASRKVQSSRLYPWNVTETLENCVDDLERMAECLQSSNPDSLRSEKKLKNFRQAAEELSSGGKYQGRDLDTDEETLPFFQDKISRMRAEVAENIFGFTSSLKTRISDASQRSNQLSREVFALQRIQNRAIDEIPSELRELTALQQSAGFISKEIGYPQVEREYRSFLGTVQNEARKPYKNTGDFVSKEEKIYSGLFTSAEKTKESRNVVKMLANTACQTHCEAVTEGWGSVIGDNVKGKVNLNHAKLSQEVFMKLNGPAPFENSNKIIEGALDRRFGSRHRWRFFKTTKTTKGYGISKVVDRMSNSKEGFPLN